MSKVKLGLNNVHYVPFTTSELGVITYGTPLRIPGAVSLTIEPRGESTEFYADDMLYYLAKNNQGYEGTFNAAKLPDHFRIHALGEVKDANGLIAESAESTGKNFALMFEFTGDERATRHILYNCSANRPAATSETKSDSVTVQPDELTFVASPRSSDRLVKLRTSDDTPEEAYKAWYDAVPEPGAPAPDPAPAA